MQRPGHRITAQATEARAGDAGRTVRYGPAGGSVGVLFAAISFHYFA